MKIIERFSSETISSFLNHFVLGVIDNILFRIPTSMITQQKERRNNAEFKC